VVSCASDGGGRACCDRRG